MLTKKEILDICGTTKELTAEEVLKTVMSDNKKKNIITDKIRKEYENASNIVIAKSLIRLYQIKKFVLIYNEGDERPNGSVEMQTNNEKIYNMERALKTIIPAIMFMKSNISNDDIAEILELISYEINRLHYSTTCVYKPLL